MLRHIPNSITCGNLLCGCIGIVQAFYNNIFLSCILIGIAVILDFLDGFAARLLKASSPIGRDLDSLADVVTFGVLPSIIVYQLLMESIPTMEDSWMAYFAFLIAIFSALRLAKFNNDSRQTEAFIGLPTPANALLIASLPFIHSYYPEWKAIIISTPNLMIFTVVMSFLLVAEIPLFALKFKSFGWGENKVRYSFLGVSVLLLAWLHVLAIPLIIVLYVVVSTILRFTTGR